MYVQFSRTSITDHYSNFNTKPLKLQSLGNFPSSNPHKF